ncbi:MAG: hypothetical protein IH991_12765 [Planctomycetes bacterium]|nr:hypothetical protein [Planctomycetota bacterium]
MKTVPFTITFFTVAMMTLVVCAVDTIIPRSKHPWGRFPVGSWKTVRVHSEIFDHQQKLRSSSITETTTTLLAVTDTQYTLRVEVLVRVAGKRFVYQPKTKTIGFNGEVNGQTVKLTTLRKATLLVNEKELACEVRRLEINDGNAKQTSIVYYSPELPPYILKRHTVSTVISTKQKNYESHVEVVGLGLPIDVLGETKTATYLKTLQLRPNGSTTTIEAHCLDVPGGVVSSTSKELGKDGNLIRRSRIELVDYERGDGRVRVYKRRWFHPRKWNRKL